MRRILVTGANGQLGSAMRLLGATSRNEYRFTDVAELDITDEEAVRRAVCDGRIDVIVNCAAYTNVDRAEEDEAAADRINRLAVGNLARAAAAADATLIHVSTRRGRRPMPAIWRGRSSTSSRAGPMPAAKASTTFRTRGSARGTTSPTPLPPRRATRNARSNPATRRNIRRKSSARPIRCLTRARSRRRSG